MVGPHKPFLDFPGAASDLTGSTDNANQKIHHLEDLIRRRPDDSDKILQLLVYEDQQMPETQIRIGAIIKPCGNLHIDRKKAESDQKNFLRKEKG